MANFQFLGDPNAFGQPVKMLVLHPKDGSDVELLPIPPATNIPVGYMVMNVTDERCLRALRVDTRFQEV